MNAPPPDSSFIPTRPGFVLGRGQGRAALDRATDESSRVVVVRAPGGSGKTTLVSEWIRSQPGGRHPACWVTMREGAGTYRTFWSMILDALKANATIAASSLSRIEPASMSRPDLVAAVVAGIGEIVERIDLVIDDYHFAADSHIEDDLLDVVSLTARLRLVIISRNRTVFENPVVVATLGTALIESRSLHFSVAETGELTKHFHLQLSESSIAALHRETHGHPLTTRVALIALAHNAGITGRVDLKMVTAAVATYHRELARTVLTFSGGEHGQGILLRTCIPPFVASSLADELNPGMPRNAVERVFDVLAADGLGEWGFEAQSRVFRFHPIVRAALLSYREGTEPVESTRALKATTARWLLAHEFNAEALNYAVDARDWAFLSEAVKKIGLGTGDGIQRAVLSVPPHQAKRYPALQVAAAVAGWSSKDSSVLRKVQAGMTLTQHIFAPNILAKNEFSIEQCWWLGTAMTAQRLGGHSHRATNSADQLVAILRPASRATLDAELGAFLGHGWSAIGVTYLAAGRYQDALDAFESQRVVAAETRRHSQELGALSNMALAHAMRGDFVAADRSLALIEELDPFYGWETNYFAVGYNLAASLSAVERGDLERARHHLSALGQHVETMEAWPFYVHAAAQLALFSGTPNAGLTHHREYLRRKTKEASPGDFLTAVILTAESQLHLALGRAAEAKKLATSASADDPAAFLVLAQIALANDRPDLALTNLNRIQDPSPGNRAGTLLLTAVALARLGGTSAALNALAEAVQVLEDFHLRTPLANAVHLELERLMDSLPADRRAEGLAMLAGRPAIYARISESRKLTPREIEVLTALVASPDIADVADSLFISKNTAKMHLKSIYRKLGVHSRDAAIVAASRQGIL